MLPINPNGRGRISDARVHLHAYLQQHARTHARVYISSQLT